MTKTPDNTPQWARTLQQGLSLNPAGVLLVMELAGSETALTFGELADRVGASRSVTSDRLRALEQAGLVHASVPAELRKGRRPCVYWIDRGALQRAINGFASIVEAATSGEDTLPPESQTRHSPECC